MKKYGRRECKMTLKDLMKVLRYRDYVLIIGYNINNVIYAGYLDDLDEGEDFDFAKIENMEVFQISSNTNYQN